MPEMPWTAMHERAAESIEFIRETMVRSASFTAVPGQGGVAMGAIGVIAAVMASRTQSWEAWLATWLIAALVATPIGLAAIIIKARRHHVALWSASGRRFMQGFLPSIVAGAALTRRIRNGSVPRSSGRARSVSCRVPWPSSSPAR